jgi:hypothetical protein
MGCFGRGLQATLIVQRLSLPFVWDLPQHLLRTAGFWRQEGERVRWLRSVEEVPGLVGCGDVGVVRTSREMDMRIQMNVVEGTPISYECDST